MLVDSDDDFDALVSKNERVMVKVTLPGCKPCKAIAPTVEELAEANKGVMVVAEVDASETKLDTMLTKYDVTAAPSFLFFRRGKYMEKFRYTGYKPKKLEERVTAFLSLS